MRLKCITRPAYDLSKTYVHDAVQMYYMGFLVQMSQNTHFYDAA